MNRADIDMNEGDLTVSNIRMMDESSQKALLFKAIRASDLHIIRNILQANRSLLNAKMFGYEGSDVYEVIKNSKTKKCYTYSGMEKDGFFYPLHVATEAGHKHLTILLIKAGADMTLTDYKGSTAEEKSNGQALHAFYELRGLKFEAKERYQGKSDRSGQRHGQGVLFYKAEGYMETEKQLYRGNFKNNLYHGHGTLYYPGTEVIAYIGRFKEGKRHGRGIEFDNQGMKVFQGNFREDKREGRGEEFGENAFRTYKGEFANNMRHGFGVAFFPEGSKYYGRYENNQMSGIGVYVHPNGDRFEGMFLNNKPDGPGSFYERDIYTGNWSGHHALWQAGRKVKEVNAVFSPTIADLPDDANKHLFTEIMNSQAMAMEEEEQEAMGINRPAESVAAAVLKPKKRLSFRYLDGNEALQAMNKADWWKIQLGKYLKLPLKDAQSLGLRLPDSLVSDLTNDKEEGEEGGGGGDGMGDEDDDEEEEVDEVSGYYFMDCTSLFVAYVYITSASKVFEDRLANKGLVAEFPDFEAVYHLVIDAVDSYNELWEDAYRAQQLRIDGNEASSSIPSTPVPSTPSRGAIATSDSGAGAATPTSATMLESRRKLFMTEKEKKEELIMKQRAELAIKKGTAELDPLIEKEISKEVLATLEQELAKLLVEEEEEEAVHLNLPIARKKPPPTPKASNKANNGEKTTKKGQEEGSIQGKTQEQPQQEQPQQQQPQPTVDIDDLFDINNIDASMNLDNYISNTNGGKGSEEEDTKSNDFAAELLYIMKTSMAFDI